jgi:cellulose synthase/poly-beta-1,6-N-acetylglucosamine synthase-like glycosyltransferase
MEEKLWMKTIKYRDKLGLFVSLTGSCQFIRSKVLKNHGGWNEKALAEDLELALKLVEKKELVKFRDDLLSWQETPSTLKNMVKQRQRWYSGCLQNLFIFGRFLKNLNKRTFDAEIVLIGPLLMAISSMSFLISVIQLTYSKSHNYVSLGSLILTVLSLFLVGVSLIMVEKPLRLRNLHWIPVIYFYWFFQSLIAFWAFLRLIVRRPITWQKTEKSGVIINPSVPRDP